MDVTVEILGEGTLELSLADPGEPTYLDLLAAIDLSPHEVSVLVDGRPVPEDRPIDDGRIQVVRMIKGG